VFGEPEGKLGRAVFLVVFHALAAFGDRWNMADRSYQPTAVDLSEMEIGLRFFALLWSSSESIPGI
jgi:hypothetical protein